MDDVSEQELVLIGWLQNRGLSGDEIQKVLGRVRQYDQQTKTDSVMDSLANGDDVLDSLIADALGYSDEDAEETDSPAG